MKPLSLQAIADRMKKITGDDKWSPQRIWYIINKKSIVPYEEALRIEKASEGRYKVADLCTDYKAIVRQMKKALWPPLPIQKHLGKRGSMRRFYGPSASSFSHAGSR